MKVSPPESQAGSRVGIGLAIATFVAIIATLLVNALSNFFPIAGLNIGEVANTILGGVQITPANYAFAIWGLIYIGLIAYGVYQFGPAQRQDPTIRRVDTLLIVACLAQIAWVYLFTLQLFWPSVVAMVAILLSLIGAYLRLGTGKGRVSRNRQWFAQTPFSIYLGWISVATIVNVASALYSSGWDGWGLGATSWTVVMLVVGAIIGSIVAVQRADVAFTSVFIWAFVAIALRQVATSAILVTAIGGAIAMAALLLWSRSKRKA
uniref:tryptophan-rich sensory protein n=1 Tax=Trichocoleus desertorum TaxID=1481672 RepID=UPI0025B3AB97|nr:tryptophan-rich sensory protein [Trichocoleus desertorum]